MSGGWRQGDRLNPRLETTPNLFPRSAGAQPTQPVNTGTRQVVGGLFTPVFTNPITVIPQIAFRNISSDGADMTITATIDFPYTFGPTDELRFILSNTTTQGTVSKDYRPADQYVIGDLNPGTYYDVTVIPKINGNVVYSISATSNVLSSTVSPPGVFYGLVGDVCDGYVNFSFQSLVPPLPKATFIAVTTNFTTIPTLIPLALGSTSFVAGPYSSGVTYSLTLQPGVQAGNVFFYQEVTSTFGPFIPGPPGDPIITNIYASNTTVYFGIQCDTTVHPTPNYFKVTGYQSTSNLLSNIVGVSGQINDLSTNYAGFFMSFQTIDPNFVSSLSGNNIQADITNELGLWYSFRVSSITSNSTGYLFTNPNFVKSPFGGSNFNINFYNLSQGSVNITSNLTLSGGLLTLQNTPSMYTTFRVQTYANHLYNLRDDYASIYPGPPGQPSTPLTPPPSVPGNNCLLLTILPPTTGPRPVSYFYNPGNPSSVASISSYFTSISLTGLTNGTSYSPYVYTYANSVSSSYTLLNYLQYNTTPNIQPPTSISIANVNNTVVTICLGRPLGGAYQYLIEASGGPTVVDISLSDTGAPFLSGTFSSGVLTTGCGYTFTGYSLSTAVYSPNNLSTARTSPALYLGPPLTPTNISGYYRSRTVYLTGSAAGYVGTNQYFINDNYGNVYTTPFTRDRPNDLNTIITNLTDGSSYTFTVTACGNGLASAPSSPITFNLYTSPPTNARLDFSGAFGVTAFVTFSGSPGGADAYIVLNGNNQTLVTVGPGSTGTQTVTISFDTVAKNNYYYQIYAQKYGVNSINSPPTNTLYSGFPLPPNNLQGVVTPNQIVFTFSHDSTDNTTTQYYKVYEYYLNPKLDPKTDPNNGFVPSTKELPYTTVSSPFTVSAVATVSQSYTIQSGQWIENIGDLYASFTLKSVNLNPPNTTQDFNYYYSSNAVSFTFKQDSSSYTFVPTVWIVPDQTTTKQISNFANPIIPKSGRLFNPARSISLTWTSYQGPLNYGTYYYKFDTIANTVQSPSDTLSIPYAMFMSAPSVPTVVFSNTTATVSFINNAANISYHIVTNIVDGSTRRVPAVANLSAVFSGLTNQTAYSFYATTYAISTISAQGNPSIPGYAGQPAAPNITYTNYGTNISLQVLDPTLSAAPVFYDTGKQSIQNSITGTAHTSEINLSLGGNWTNSSTPPFYTSVNGFVGPASVTYNNSGVVNAYISLSTSIPSGSQLGIGLPIIGGSKYTISLTSTQISFFDYQNASLYKQTISGNSFQIQRISNQFTVYNNGLLVNTIPTTSTSFIDSVIITSTGTSTFSYFGVSNTSTSGVQPSNYAITLVPSIPSVSSTGIPQFYSITGLTPGNSYTITISSQGNQVYSLTNTSVTFYPHSVQPLPPAITISNVTVNLSVAKVVDNANPPKNEPDVYSVVASNTQTGIVLTLSLASSGLSTYGFQFTGLVSQNLYSFYAYTMTNGITCNSTVQQYTVGPPVAIQSVSLQVSPSTLTTPPAGCILWLDASDPNATGVPAANGTPISVWKDKSGLGSNATASGTPTMNTVGLNGKPTINFNGSSWFDGLTTCTGTTITVFMVMQQPVQDNYMRVLSMGPLGDVDYTSGLLIEFAYNYVYCYRNNLVSPFAQPVNSPYITSFVVDATRGVSYLNGSPQPGFGSSGNINIGRFRIGGIDFYDPGGRYTGYVSEVLVLNTAVTSSQRQNIETYLGNKWGIATVTTNMITNVVVPGGLTADTSYIISICGSGTYTPYSGVTFTSTPFNSTLSNGDTYRAWVYPVRNNVVGTPVSSAPISFNPVPPSASSLSFNTTTLCGSINYAASPTTIGNPVQTFSLDGVNYSANSLFQGVYGTIYNGFVKTTTNGLTSSATGSPPYNLFTNPPPSVTATYYSTNISLTWTSALQPVQGSRTPAVLPDGGYTVVDLCGNYTGFAANYSNTTLSLSIAGVLGKTYAFNVRAVHSNLLSYTISGNANTVYLTTNPVNTITFQSYYGTNISMGWVEPVQLDGSPKPNGGYYVQVATNSVLSTPQFPNTTVPSYTFGNVGLNSNYYYVITAIHNGVSSSTYQTPTVAVSTVTLTNVQQDYTGSNVTVSWNFTGNADSFVITDKLGNYPGSYTGITGGASLTFSTGVQLATLYQFGAAAVKNGVRGVITYATNTISLYTIPPTNVTADYSTYTMTVSWTAPSVVPNGGYYITDANGNTGINTATATSTQFSVVAGKTYKFSVYAVHKGISSAVTLGQSISLFTYPPTGFTTTVNGLTLVNTWTAPTPAPNGGYVLTDICGSAISSKTGTSTSYPAQNDISDYTFTGSAGSYHDFTLYSINKGISSAVVQAPSVSIYAAVPTNVTMSNAGTTIQINWITSTNLTYTVGRYVNSIPIDFTPSLPYTGPTQYNYTGTVGSTYQFYVYSTNVQGISSQKISGGYIPAGSSIPLIYLTLSSAPIPAPPIAQWLAGPSIKVYYDVGVIYGDYIGTGGQSLPITAIGQTNDATPQNVYMIYDNAYTKMVAADGTAKFYTGTPSQFSVQNWSTYSVQTAGHYNLSLKSTMTEWDGAMSGITYSISETNSFVTPVTSTALRSNTFVSASPNQTYTFNVAGIYNGLKSSSLGSTPITLTSTPPSSVAVTYSGTNITINWATAYQTNDYSNYPTGGYILSDLCNHFNSGSDYTAGGSTATSINVTGLPGVTYKFRVYAKHKDIPSSATVGNEITLTIPGTPTLTLAATGTSVTTTFNAVSPAADSYTLTGIGGGTVITSFPPYTGTLTGGVYGSTYTIYVTTGYKGIYGTPVGSNITFLAPPTASCSPLGVITVNWTSITGATYVVNEYSNGTFQLSGTPSPATNNQIQFNAAGFNGNTYTYRIVASTPNVTVTTLDSTPVTVAIVPGTTTQSVLSIDYYGTTITTTWTAETPAADTIKGYLYVNNAYYDTAQIKTWTTGQARTFSFVGSAGNSYSSWIDPYLNSVKGATVTSAGITLTIPGTPSPTLSKSGPTLTVTWAQVTPAADTFTYALYRSDGTQLETHTVAAGTYSYAFVTSGVGNTTYYARVTGSYKGISGTAGQSANVTVQAPGLFTSATLTYNNTTLTAAWTTNAPTPDTIVGTLFTNGANTGTTSNWTTGTTPIQLQFTGTIGSNHYVQLAPSLAGVNGTLSNTNTVYLNRPYIVASDSAVTYSGTTSTLTSWQGTSPPDSTHPSPTLWTVYQYTNLLDTRTPAPITVPGGTVAVGDIQEFVDRISPYFVVGSSIVNAINSTVKSGLQGGSYGNYRALFVGNNGAAANFVLGSAISTFGNGWIFSNSSASKTSSNVFSGASSITLSILNNAGIVTGTSTSNITVTSTTASFTGLTMGATYQYGIIAVASGIVSETTPTNFSPPSTLPITIPGSNAVLGIPAVSSTDGLTTVTWSQTTPAADTFVVNEFMTPVLGKQVFTPTAGAVLTNVKMPYGNYSLAFTITLNTAGTTWSNVLHISSDGTNDTRTPSFFVTYPGLYSPAGQGLHIRWGDTTDRNFGINELGYLAIGVPTRVVMNAMGKYVNITVGTAVSNVLQPSWVSSTNTGRPTGTNYSVYMSQPTPFLPADCTITDIDYIVDGIPYIMTYPDPTYIPSNNNGYIYGDFIGSGGGLLPITYPGTTPAGLPVYGGAEGYIKWVTVNNNQAKYVTAANYNAGHLPSIDWNNTTYYSDAVTHYNYTQNYTTPVVDGTKFIPKANTCIALGIPSLVGTYSLSFYLTLTSVNLAGVKNVFRLTNQPAVDYGTHSGERTFAIWTDGGTGQSNVLFWADYKDGTYTGPRSDIPIGVPTLIEYYTVANTSVTIKVGGTAVSTSTVGPPIKGPFSVFIGDSTFGAATTTVLTGMNLTIDGYPIISSKLPAPPQTRPLYDGSRIIPVSNTTLVPSFPVTTGTYTLSFYLTLNASNSSSSNVTVFSTGPPSPANFTYYAPGVVMAGNSSSVCIFYNNGLTTWTPSYIPLSLNIPALISISQTSTQMSMSITQQIAPVPIPQSSLTTPPVSGYDLWYDGSDPNGNGSTPSDGTVINTWVNKGSTGSTNNAVSTAGASYSLPYNALSFNTKLYTTNYPANPSTSTIFAVFNNTGVSTNANQWGFIGSSTAGGLSLACGYSAGGGVGSIGLVNAGVVWGSSSPTASYKPGTTAIAVAYVNGSNTGVAVNGTDFSTLSNFSGTKALVSGTKLVLGYHRGDLTTNSANSYGYPFVGYAMEILVYPSILTTTQIQQVQSYLSQKWSTRSQVVNATFTSPNTSYTVTIGDGYRNSASNVTITGLNYMVDGKTIIAPMSPINRVLMEQNVVTGTTTTFSNVTPGSFQYQVIPYLSNDAGVYANQSCVTTPVLTVNVANFSATGVASPQTAASGQANPGTGITLNWTPYTPPTGQSSFYTYDLYMGATNIASNIAGSTASIYVSPSYLTWGTTTFTLKITYTGGGTTTRSTGASTSSIIIPTASAVLDLGSTTYTMPAGNYSALPVICQALGGGGGGGYEANWCGGGGGGGGGYSTGTGSAGPGQSIVMNVGGGGAGSSGTSSTIVVNGTKVADGGGGAGGENGSSGHAGNGGAGGSGTSANGYSGGAGGYQGFGPGFGGAGGYPGTKIFGAYYGFGGQGGSGQTNGTRGLCVFNF